MRTKTTARRTTHPRPNSPIDQSSKSGHTSTSNDSECFEWKAEIKHLESRFDSDGYAQLYEAGSAPPKADKADKFRQYIICSTRAFNHSGYFSGRQLEVKSPQLKGLLRGLILDYPGTSFNTSKITLNVPYHVLWHYFDELHAALDSEEDGTELKTHLKVMMEYLDDEFSETIQEYENLVPEGLISFEILWTLFKPGELVFTHIYGKPRVLRLDKFAVVSDMAGKRAVLNSTYVDYDGKRFGENSTALTIPYFDGTAKISELSALPFELHPKQEEVKEELIKRGMKYVSMQGAPKCMEYKGIALDMERYGISRVSVDGRIMVDADSHATFNPDNAKSLKSLSRVKVRTAAASKEIFPVDSLDDCYDSDDYNYDSDSDVQNRNASDNGQNFDTPDAKVRKIYNLTDDQCLLCNSMVWGYTLEQKKWVLLFVELIKPASWNLQAFDKLVLPAAQKDLVQALVEAHTDPDKSASFDDFIANKGKGLISVLHGPPGVGKTLTAESVAEFAKRPLYTVSAGSLGITAEALEDSLEDILKLCTVWNAVLLLDEADVYLEERSLHDLNRNAMVSVFLRLLEYYQGILFLTTNRVKTFDEAFQSRIHIALRYRNLDKPARIQVWRNFMEKIEGGKETTNRVEMSEEDYETLGDVQLNGRQIKNAARTAVTLAQKKKEKLGVQHLKTVLGVVQAFEHDFREGKKSTVLVD